MTLDPYHHEHTGVEEIPWSRLALLLPKLAQKIRGDWQPEIVVGIAKGGVIPAAYLSSSSD
jgi:hypoxanthine phosphoribosyltransferase